MKTAFHQSLATALGYRAKANHEGWLVWAGVAGADFASTAPNQFLIRAVNGVGINTNNPAATLDVNGSFRAGFGTTIFKNLQGGSVADDLRLQHDADKLHVHLPESIRRRATIIVAATTRTVNIVRMDNNSGWGQLLFLNWFAWE
jgi:hypothetical protein